jgi:hypothetical protein
MLRGAWQGVSEGVIGAGNLSIDFSLILRDANVVLWADIVPSLIVVNDIGHSSLALADATLIGASSVATTHVLAMFDSRFLVLFMMMVMFL